MRRQVTDSMFVTETRHYCIIIELTCHQQRSKPKFAVGAKQTRHWLKTKNFVNYAKIVPTLFANDVSFRLTTNRIFNWTKIAVIHAKKNI